MKMGWGVEIKLHDFLTSAADGDQWLASLPGRFTLGKETLVPFFIGGWVGPRTGLDAVVNRRNPCPCRESNPSRPARSLVTMITELIRF
jgi:hypothetical protein